MSLPVNTVRETS